MKELGNETLTAPSSEHTRFTPTVETPSIVEQIIQLWFAGKDYSNLKQLADAAPELHNAALDVEAAGRPHSRECECEQCEAWDKLVRALSKAEGKTE